MSLGKQLKNRREQLSLTQQEVADQIHVSRQTISNWEVGRNYPDIPTIIQLSDYYDISLDALLKGDEHLMKKMNEDAELLRRIKKRKVLDGLLIGIIALLFLLGIIDKINFTANWLPVILIAVLYILTVVRYFIIIPKDSLNSGWHSPIVVPKTLGVGWAFNPRNPIGLALYIVLFVAVLWLMITSWADRGLFVEN
ncbi:helix-turn-helix domain-containing protein [Enterococcus sp. BWR-S5]|uniref:helix-turn-helix domain-containing protein n=1 Tax=Enterococcus sp. BWR-S5 TaxID=2787714 RepID=UPI001924C9BD|nr:helix-turn-helix transcriptional regulator [Enterococcus sp. BWR-S5]MBL1226430.1 helix-turn-helix transcriptional regulator [Enterococcus sp. BWR-S5]